MARRPEQPTETFLGFTPTGRLVRLMAARKYRNRPTQYAGQLYPSAAEAARAAMLEMLRRAGEIKSWRRGERTLILDGGPGRRVWYTPDFIVVELDDKEISEDVKGAVPRDFRIRAILYEMATGKPLRVVDRHGAEIWTPSGKRGARRKR